jgi:hypothetical protein
MIVSFSVSNFRSFSLEETFSLVASNRLTGHEKHLAGIPDSKEKVLRTAVVYGANGAGKSNLFKALRYVKEVALGRREKNGGTGREVFRFGGMANEPSTFDLQFIAGERLYRFGFKVDDERVIEEWLVHVDGGRDRTLYERVTDGNGKVTVDAQGLKGAGEKLLALAKVGGPQNQSFLATIEATLEWSGISRELDAVLIWFQWSLRFVDPGGAILPLVSWLSSDPDRVAFAGRFLNSASTGVDHLEVVKREVSEDEVSRPQSGLFDDGAGDVMFEGGKFYRVGIQAAHKDHIGRTFPLELADESDGTRRLLGLTPALHHSEPSDEVYFIDEIDRSLHPMLVWRFLELFLTSCGHQIIVTTHESNLLDLDLLRRDEIWFAEKDGKSATHLYSLMDFKVRNDLEIRKHYLQGRFGAIPFLGNLDRLMEKGQPV